MMKERRTSKRVYTQTLVSYSITDENQDISSEGIAKSLDLSAMGVHLAISQEIQTGAKMNLTVGAGEEMVNLQGKTVWAKGNDPLFEVGLRVDNPPKEYTQLLEDLGNL